MKKISLVIAVLVAMLTFTGSALADVYDVVINTSGLSGGPFTLDFYLTDGNSVADTNVTISNIDLGGGTYTGAPLSSFTLSDSVFFDQVQAGFNPGAYLAFVFNFSSAGDAVNPDFFAFAIDELNTNDASNSLVSVQFDSAHPSPSAFSATTYAGGNNTVQGVTPVVTVPEPASLTLIGGGMLITALRRRMKAKK